MMRKIKEWAELCSDDTIRKQWIANADRQCVYHWRKNTEMPDMADALLFSFDYNATTQGKIYWCEIRYRIRFFPENYLKKRKKMFYEYEDN